MTNDDDLLFFHCEDCKADARLQHHRCSSVTGLMNFKIHTELPAWCKLPPCKKKMRISVDKSIVRQTHDVKACWYLAALMIDLTNIQ